MGLVSAFLLGLAVAKATAPPPRLRIDMVFEGRTMSRARTDTAAREVRAIWAPYGVDVRVAAVAPQARVDGITLHVMLAERSDPRLSREALGSINFRGDTPVPLIVLYPTRVEEQVSMAVSGHASEYPEARWEYVVGRVMGRALAHEIGHFLLRQRDHSRRGLMQAHQLVPDLMLEDRRCCSLSSADVLALENRLAAADYLDWREYAISTALQAAAAAKDR